MKTRLVLHVAVIGLVSLVPAFVTAERPDVAIPGADQTRTMQVAQSFGALTENLALELPPGRMRPSLSLSYSSLSGAAQSGRGWTYELGSIERSYENGAPAVAALEKYAFRFGGSQAQIIAVGNGAFRPETETEYRSYRRAGDAWEVKDTLGTIYRFGSSPASRVVGPGPTDNSEWIVEWLVDEVEDRHGNRLRVDYRFDQGTPYIQAIHFGGNARAGAPERSHVEFSYEPRPDVRVSMRWGKRQVAALRLSDVRMTVDGDQARRYVLGYEQSLLNTSSLLARVGLRGLDDAAELDLRHYEYTEPPPGFSESTVAGNIPLAFYDSESKDLGTQLADVNGDTYADLVRARNGEFRVLLGDGAGGFADSSGWTSALAAVGLSFVNNDGQDLGVRLLDIDGDARPDLVRASSKPVAHQVFLNTGSGWSLSPGYSSSLASISESATAQLRYVDPALCQPPMVDGGPILLPPGCEDLVVKTWQFALVREDGDVPGAQFADVNADGRADILWSYETTPRLFELPGPDGVTTTQRVPAVIRAVYLNTGAAFVRNERLSDALARISTPLPAGTAYDPNNPDHQRIGSFVVDTQLQGYGIADVNGDGLSDIVRTHADYRKQVFLGTGVGFAYDGTLSSSLDGLPVASFALDGDGNPTAQGLVPLDYNGDGLLDYLRADEGLVAAWQNTGSGWEHDESFSQHLAAVGFRQADAEGKPWGQSFGDVNGDGAVDLVFARGGEAAYVRFGVMVRPDLLRLARTLYGEETRVTYASSSEFDHEQPGGVAAFPTVLPVVTQVERLDGVGQRYAYRYGYGGGAYSGRRVRGFGFAEETDPRGATSRTVYHQDDDRIGRVASLDVRDSLGVLRQRVTAEYEIITPVAGVRQVRTTASQEQIVDDDGALTTRVETSYDTYLRITEVRKRGDVTLATDDSRAVYEYAANWSTHVIGLASTMRTFGHDGRLLSESVTLYDGLPLGQVERGNPTRSTDRVNASSTVSRNMEYDVYGKLVRLVDRTGRATTFAYDALHHDFAERTQNALGQVTVARNHPLLGRPSATTDANGAETSYEYDNFGRIVVEREPGDDCSPNGTRSFSYSDLGDPGQQWAAMHATERPGQPDTLDRRVFYDGLLRRRRWEIEGSSGTIHARLEHDDADQIALSVRPHYASEPEAALSLKRDTQRRVILATLPDGTSTRVVFAGKAQTVYDAGSVPVRYEYDAFKNLVATHELVGAREIVTRRELDEQGNIRRVVDPAGQEWTVDYDMLGRRTRVVDPTAGAFSFEYDAEDRLLRQRDGAGRTTSYTYNALGQLLTRTMPGAPTLLGQPTTTTARYSYGSAPSAFNVGRLVRVDDEVGSLEFKYNPRGKVAQRRRLVNQWPERAYVTGYEYDSMDRLTRVIYPDGYRADYQYDRGGLVSSVVDEAGKALVRMPAYTATGKPLQLAYGNQVVTDHSYDQAEHLTSIVTQGPALPLLGLPDPLQDFSYGYDARGNLTSIEDAARGNDQQFQYNERNFLTRASGPYGTKVYEYDDIGNLIRKGDSVFHSSSARKQQADCTIDLRLADRLVNGLPWDERLLGCARDMAAASSGLSADARAKLNTILARGSILSPEVGSSYEIAYDIAGNVSQKGSTGYEYDSANRLTKVRDALGLVAEENLYGADGRRVVQYTPIRRTVFVDGIYERVISVGEVDTVTRHIPVGDRVLASVQSPRLASPLISDTPTDELTSCYSRAGVIAGRLEDAERYVRRGLQGAPERVESLTAARLARIHSTLLACTGAALALLLAVWAALRYTSPWRRVLSVRAWRSGAHIARQVARNYRYARRRPGEAFTALVLLASHAGYAGCGYHQERPLAGAEGSTSLLEISARAYYHYDHLGNVHVVSDDNGFARSRTEIQPFGERDYHNEQPIYEPLKPSYNGHSHERGSGLYYFGARHYDAELGRFMSVDPLIPDERMSVALHRYAFNANNPVRYIDPSGYSFWDGFKKALVWIGVAVITVVSIVISVVTFGAAAALSAMAIGAAIGFAIGFAVGAVLSAKLGSGFDLKTAFLFAAAGAMLGMAIGGMTFSAPSIFAQGAITLKQTAALMHLGAVLGTTGGVIAGATARNGVEAIALYAMMGWGAGAAVGLANAGGAAWAGGQLAGGALSGLKLAGGTVLGAFGFTSVRRAGEHVLGVISGERRIEEMAGERPKPPTQDDLIPKPEDADPVHEQSAPPGSGISWTDLLDWLRQLLGLKPRTV